MKNEFITRSVLSQLHQQLLESEENIVIQIDYIASDKEQIEDYIFLYNLLREKPTSKFSIKFTVDGYDLYYDIVNHPEYIFKDRQLICVNHVKILSSALNSNRIQGPLTLIVHGARFFYGGDLFGFLLSEDDVYRSSCLKGFKNIFEKEKLKYPITLKFVSDSLKKIFSADKIDQQLEFLKAIVESNALVDIILPENKEPQLS